VLTHHGFVAIAQKSFDLSTTRAQVHSWADRTLRYSPRDLGPLKSQVSLTRQLEALRVPVPVRKERDTREAPRLGSGSKGPGSGA
jgi:hypothetical protein